MAALSIRIDFAPGFRLGPGKVRLLEALAEHGSISAAGRSLGMSYKRAWDLIAELNGAFERPVVEARPGGSGGGGARLTDFGGEVVRRYRRIEAAAEHAARAEIAPLEAALQRAEPAGGEIPHRG